MENANPIKNITSAIVKTMQAIKGVEKSTTVGTGYNSYKGVRDYDVKKICKEAMAENGLALITTEIKTEVQINTWEVEYQGAKIRKRQVFTQANVKYLLIHTSGESLEMAGYGHGMDSQDKSAGKATTYAMKYALMYLFLIPAGNIDDSDNTHSEEIETPAHPELKKVFDVSEFEKVETEILEAFLKGQTVARIKSRVLKSFDGITAEALTAIKDLQP